MTTPKRMLNLSEEKTLAELQRVTDAYGGRVFPAPRFSRVLTQRGTPLESLGLKHAEFDYGTRAELDFYVEFSAGGGFAVEFDGPHHASDPITILRDANKDRICRKARLELLRIGDDFISRRDRVALLAWLVEARFLLYEHDAAIDDASEHGHNPFLLSEQSFKVTGNLMQSVDRIVRRQGRRAQRWMSALGPDDNYHSLAVATVVGDYIVYGTGRCRSFRFATIHPAELAYELAYYNLAMKLDRFDSTPYRGLSQKETDESWDEVYAHDCAAHIVIDRQEALIKAAIEKKYYKNVYLLRDHVYEEWEREGRPPMYLPGDDEPTTF